jgi:hypothetical protein
LIVKRSTRRVDRNRRRWFARRQGRPTTADQPSATRTLLPVSSHRIEQRGRLRQEPALADATVVVRGGRDTLDKIRAHALRTARAWALDGEPLLGVSVFAVLDLPLDALLRDRFATFRTVYLPEVADLVGQGFELLPTGLRPHFTVRVRTVEDDELHRLVAALGPQRDNPAYGTRTIWGTEV